MHLRWAGAIAVRGRFKGMQRPDTCSSIPQEEVVGPSAKLLPGTEAAASSTEPPWSRAATIIGQLVSIAPSAIEISHLIDYYDREICGNMVWVDTEQNPYRRLVLPLAETEPILLLSILAIASEHGAALQSRSSEFSENARNIVLSNITQEIQTLFEPSSGRHRSPGGMDLATAEWVLASILVLSNYETVRMDSTVWCSHRLGGRTLINAISYLNCGSSELWSFLRMQFSIYDVLLSTTTHIQLKIEDNILPELCDSDSMFAEYLMLIHQVSSFAKNAGTKESERPRTEVVRARFETARGLSLMAAGRLGAMDRHTRCILIWLMDIYHVSGLLFAYHSAYAVPDSIIEVKALEKELFEKIAHYTANAGRMPAISWPLFIAGTVCHKIKERESLVMEWCEKLVAETGFRYYRVVESFLQDLWLLDDQNWQKMAEDWEGMGKPILAI